MSAELAAAYRRQGFWRDEPLDRFVLRTAATDPDRIALVAAENLTHGELLTAVDAAASAFSGLGLRAGDRVLVQLPNVADLVVTVLGLLRSGLVPVLAVPALGVRELRHVARTTSVRGAVLHAGRHRADFASLVTELRASGLVEHCVTLADQRGRHLGVPDEVDLGELLAQRGAVVPAHRAQPDDIAFFLLSGGTTGPPKAIPRTHQDYVYNLELSIRLAGVDENSRYLVALPATHNFALGCPGVLGTLAAGGTAVLGESTVDSLAELVERERVTVTALVPGLATGLIRAGRDLSTLRVLQVGGAKLYEPDARRILAAGVRVQQVFGMAEGLLNFTRLTDPPEVLTCTQGRPASPGDEYLVIDDDGVPVAPGDAGELLVRGPYTIRGYLASDEANQRSFTPDGYYRTGDVVRLHPSGNFVVEGRRKDFINRGGEKISASEIEELLADCPLVGASAVVPRPDDFFGETVAVAVVPAPGAEPGLSELRAFLRSLGLAAYKLPIELLTLDRLPLTAVGKVDRAALVAALTGRTEDVAAGTRLPTA